MTHPYVGTAFEYFLDKPLKDLASDPHVEVSDAQKERHRIFSLLLMAIVHHYWNGNKAGRNFQYPLNPIGGRYMEGDYLGHNISAIAVDFTGRVIDFEFNHNEIFNSSAEHAEARLTRRVFSLAQLSDSWVVNGEDRPEQSYGNQLNTTTVYTSLESCSQCSGIMALGTVKEVVYLQTDPGMYKIGNILRKLTDHRPDSTLPKKRPPLLAPLPIPASSIGLSYFDELNATYATFKEMQKEKLGLPFQLDRNGKPIIKDGKQEGFTTSITSFLCTQAAFSIYGKAAAEFQDMKLAFADYIPPVPSDVKVDPRTLLSNLQAYEEARNFLDYACRKGRRGTPHH